MGRRDYKGIASEKAAMRRDLLVELVTANPGKAERELFKLWVHSDQRKAARLKPVGIEQELAILAKAGRIEARFQTARTFKGRSFREWFPKN